MPIQIIDNFDLNAPRPIDNRFVVGPTSFYTHRDLIPYKYPGMRIWDLNNSIPYVWTGTTYSSENSVAVTGTGTPTRIPKLTLSNVIGDSLITDSGTNVGIGFSSAGLATDKLHVNGNIKTNGIFYGNGTGVTNLVASNIQTGTMSLARLSNAPSGRILMTTATTPNWVVASNVSVGTASNLSVVSDSSSATNHYISFFPTTSGGQAKVSPNLLYIPQTGELVSTKYHVGTGNKAVLQSDIQASNRFVTIPTLGQNSTFAFLQQSQTFTTLQTFSSGISITDGSPSAPGIRFSTQTNTGFYRPSTGVINVTLAGDALFGFRRSGPGLGVLGVNTVTPKVAIGLQVNGDIANRDGDFVGNNRYYGGSPAAWRVNQSSVTSGRGWIMKIESDGHLHFRTSGTGSADSVSVDYDQFVLPTNTTLYNNTSAVSANLCVDSSNIIKRATSSIKYKTNIEDMDSDYARKIYEMRPVYYKSKNNDDNPDWSWWGLIAEELSEIDPRLVSWGYEDDCFETIDGLRKLKNDSVMTPSGVFYDRISVLLLKVIQDLRKEIDDLKS